MGTRSTIEVIEMCEDGGEVTLVNMYQQFDGYLDGVGKELANYLSWFSIVNGLGGHNPEGPIANGAGCLAAQIVAKFKTAVGGTYLVGPNDREGYHYQVRVHAPDKLNPRGAIRLTAIEYDKVVFEGSPADFLDELPALCERE